MFPSKHADQPAFPQPANPAANRGGPYSSSSASLARVVSSQEQFYSNSQPIQPAEGDFIILYIVKTAVKAEGTFVPVHKHSLSSLISPFSYILLYIHKYLILLNYLKALSSTVEHFFYTNSVLHYLSLSSAQGVCIGQEAPQWPVHATMIVHPIVC